MTTITAPSHYITQPSQRSTLTPNPGMLDGTSGRSDRGGVRPFGPLPIGVRVVLSGLVAKPELNGKLGVVTEVMENGRLRVMPARGDTSYAVKPENLLERGQTLPPPTPCSRCPPRPPLE